MGLPIIIDSNGVERFLGNLPAKPGRLKAWPVYGDVPDQPMILRSQWDSLIPENDAPDLAVAVVSTPHDQDGVGMCNCSATAGCMEDARLEQGLPMVHLSGGDLYYRISGGRDDGSTLEDGIHEAMANGIASVSVVPYLQWQWTTPGAAQDRKKYRVLGAFLCPTFDHCMSASLSGFRLVSGILWYDNFNVDQDGWLPANGRGNYGGHAIRGYKPVKRRGKYGIWHRNSWTANWGVRGDMVIGEEHYTSDIGGWWAVRYVVDEGGVLPPLNAA